MLLRRLCIFLGVVAAVLAVTTESLAFCRQRTCDENDSKCARDDDDCVSEGSVLTWKSLPLPYRFYSGGSSELDDTKMRKAVRAAFRTWENVQCDDGLTSLRFEEGDDIEDDKPLGIEAAEAERTGVAPFGIYFRDEIWTHDGADTIAATFQAFKTPSGVLTYADFEVNTANNKFHFESDQDTADIDFQSVMTHEIGHYFGLAHSKDPESIMAPVYCTGATDRCVEGPKSKRALSEDDIAAVCTVYPHTLRPSSASFATLLDSDEPKSTAGCAVSRGQLGSRGASGALAMIAAFIVRRRAKR